MHNHTLGFLWLLDALLKLVALKLSDGGVDRLLERGRNVFEECVDAAYLRVKLCDPVVYIGYGLCDVWRMGQLLKVVPLCL